MNTQACRSEFQANVEGFNCYANVNAKISKPAVVVRFPLVKVACYALSLLIIFAIAKPFIL